MAAPLLGDLVPSECLAILSTRSSGKYVCYSEPLSVNIDKTSMFTLVEDPPPLEPGLSRSLGQNYKMEKKLGKTRLRQDNSPFEAHDFEQNCIQEGPWAPHMNSTAHLITFLTIVSLLLEATAPILEPGALWMYFSMWMTK